MQRKTIGGGAGVELAGYGRVGGVTNSGVATVWGQTRYEGRKPMPTAGQIWGAIIGAAATILVGILAFLGVVVSKNRELIVQAQKNKNDAAAAFTDDLFAEKESLRSEVKDLRGEITALRAEFKQLSLDFEREGQGRRAAEARAEKAEAEVERVTEECRRWRTQYEEEHDWANSLAFLYDVQVNDREPDPMMMQKVEEKLREAGVLGRPREQVSRLAIAKMESLRTDAPKEAALKEQIEMQEEP